MYVKIWCKEHNKPLGGNLEGFPMGVDGIWAIDAGGIHCPEQEDADMNCGLANKWSCVLVQEKPPYENIQLGYEGKQGFVTLFNEIDLWDSV